MQKQLIDVSPELSNVERDLEQEMEAAQQKGKWSKTVEEERSPEETDK